MFSSVRWLARRFTLTSARNGETSRAPTARAIRAKGRACPGEAPVSRKPIFTSRPPRRRRCGLWPQTSWSHPIVAPSRRTVSKGQIVVRPGIGVDLGMRPDLEAVRFEGLNAVRRGRCRVPEQGRVAEGARGAPGRLLRVVPLHPDHVRLEADAGDGPVVHTVSCIASLVYERARRPGDVVEGRAGLVYIGVAADLEGIGLQRLDAVRHLAGARNQIRVVAQKGSGPEHRVVAVSKGDHPDRLEADAGDGAVVAAVAGVAAATQDPA